MAFDFSSTSCSGDVEEISAVCYREGYEEFLERDDDDQYLQDMGRLDNDDTILRILDGALPPSSIAIKEGSVLLADALAKESAAWEMSLQLDTKEIANAARAVETPQEFVEDFDDDSTRLNLAVTYFLGTCSLQQAVPLSLEFLPMLEISEDSGVDEPGRVLTSAREWVVTHRTIPSALNMRGSVFGAPVEWVILAVVSALALAIFSTAVAATLCVERKSVPVAQIV
jgi:hypothetical protein